MSTPAALAPNAVPAQRAGLCCHELDGEAVLYDPAHHAVHYLNATAYLIFQHCDRRGDLNDVLGRLGQCFTNDGPDHARDDEILTAFEHLVENGLIDRGELQAT